MENKLSVTVNVVFMDGRSHVELMIPPNQKSLPIESIGKILAAGLALTIRTSSNEAEFMKEIIEYLNNEFVSPDSFNDAKKFV